MRKAIVRPLHHHAASPADHLIQIESDLIAGRDDLDTLCRSITDLQRGEVVKPLSPSQIAQAINPLEPLGRARKR